MFESSIEFLAESIELKFGEQADSFYDIHCSDPVDKNNEHEFPFVALHPSGLYLIALLNDSKQGSENTVNNIEYAGRIFKSYFYTKVPIRLIFVFYKDLYNNGQYAFDVFDYAKRKMVTDAFSSVEEVLDFLDNFTEKDNDNPNANEYEQDELTLRLSKEGSEALSSEYTNKNYFIKKDDAWAPAFTKNSEKVFRLALFGGFLGLHRFYLGLFGSGIFYALTLGCFGLGWFFDCLEIIIGSWKKKGKYLLPMENRKRHIIEMFAVFGSLIIIALLLTTLI